jgi:hypothetical protein
MAAALLALGAGGAAANETMVLVPPLDAPTHVPGEVIMRGELRSSLDGSAFDAITQDDHFPPFRGGDLRLGGLYDPEAGGLRVAEQDLQHHVFRLVPLGTPGRGCLVAGVPSPCLVPRVDALAHERLLTEEAFRATLLGSVTAELVPGPTPPLLTSSETSAVGWFAAVAALLGAGALGRMARRLRRATAIGQVHVAAAAARRALRGDATLARARETIDDLVGRADALERTRRACAARLKKLDPAGLESRRAVWAGSQSPEAIAALAALAAEAAEAEQLAADLVATVAGLERIASSLRALALRTRADRGTRAVAPDVRWMLCAASSSCERRPPPKRRARPPAGSARTDRAALRPGGSALTSARCWRLTPPATTSAS